MKLQRQKGRKEKVRSLPFSLSPLLPCHLQLEEINATQQIEVPQ
jgi:hypothetical protein